MFCLVPPIEEVPEGDWFCPRCIASEKRAENIGFLPGKVRVFQLCPRVSST